MRRLLVVALPLSAHSPELGLVWSWWDAPSAGKPVQAIAGLAEGDRRRRA
ncbi:MAG TPA: hypothetical protein VFD49_14380 [Candidatus Dormibacteraeota bacterium]|nr:hypothetical protein [Candidatus Dormibacteraeota bacterium]